MTPTTLTFSSSTVGMFANTRNERGFFKRNTPRRYWLASKRSSTACDIDAKQLEEELYWHEQKKKNEGVDRIAVGAYSSPSSSSSSDPVLDWTIQLGCVPSRVWQRSSSSSSSSNTRRPSRLDKYLAIIQRTKGRSFRRKRWFNTESYYHVPKINHEMEPSANFTDFLQTVQRAQTILGTKTAVPAILGPVSYVLWCRLNGISSTEFLQKLLPVYSSLLSDLTSKLHVESVQIHEPALVASYQDEALELANIAYSHILSSPTLPEMELVTSFSSLDDSQVYRWACSVPFSAISINFGSSSAALSLVENFGFQGKRLGVGIIDGDGAWAAQSDETVSLIQRITKSIDPRTTEEIILQPAITQRHDNMTQKQQRFPYSSIFYWNTLTWTLLLKQTILFLAMGLQTLCELSVVTNFLVTIVCYLQDELVAGRDAPQEEGTGALPTDSYEQRVEYRLRLTRDGFLYSLYGTLDTYKSLLQFVRDHDRIVLLTILLLVFCV